MKWGEVAGGQARGGWNFSFCHITILFHQCNNKKIIYQEFYCCLRYIFFTSLYYCFNVFFPSPENNTFDCGTYMVEMLIIL